jgi:outer membrane lipoprotein carrier protein
MLRLVLAAALSAAALHVHAASSVEQLRSFLKQTQRAQGEFTQRVAGKGAPQTSSGAFQFQRPGKFRWTYRAPYEQVIVGDGEKLFLYDKDLNQVTVKKLAAALPASPASILFGSNQFERDFEVSDGGVRDGLAWVLAKPRSRDTTFETIEIGFKDNLPAAMVLKDSFGQTTWLAFSKFARDVVPGADAFRFVPPQGTDVLEEK